MSVIPTAMQLLAEARRGNPVGHLDYGLAVSALAGLDEVSALLLRDASGPEMDALARFARAVDLQRPDVVDFVRGACAAEGLTAAETAELVRSLPRGVQNLRAWASRMFQSVMLCGVVANVLHPRERMQDGKASQGARIATS